MRAERVGEGAGLWEVEPFVLERVDVKSDETE